MQDFHPVPSRRSKKEQWSCGTFIANGFISGQPSGIAQESAQKEKASDAAEKFDPEGGGVFNLRISPAH
jgi:hypothetical protein